MTIRRGRTVYIPPYQSAAESKIGGCILWTLFALLILGLPALVHFAEQTRALQSFAFDELALRGIHPISTDDSAFTREGLIGEAVWVHGRGDELSVPVLSDEDFQVSAPHNSLRLRREVEYCQWMETSSDERRRDSNGDEYTVRTYYYVKGWHSHPIPSLLFDQPAAHHNPPRAPYSNGEKIAPEATLGPYRLTSSLVSRPSTFKPVFYAPELLDGWFTQSAAHLAHGFVYLPNGYFYSSYEPSAAEQSARWALQYLEGTLFDYQLGDLFSQCNAGDIRVRFQSVTPGAEGLSVIARLADSAGTLEPIPTRADYPVGLVYEGLLQPNEMLDRARSEAARALFFARGLLFVWACVVVECIKVKSPDRYIYLAGWQRHGLTALMLTAISCAIIQHIHWGFTLSGVALLLGGGAGLFYIMQHPSIQFPAPSAPPK